MDFVHSMKQKIGGGHFRCAPPCLWRHAPRRLIDDLRPGPARAGSMWPAEAPRETRSPMCVCVYVMYIDTVYVYIVHILIYCIYDIHMHSTIYNMIYIYIYVCVPVARRPQPPPPPPPPMAWVYPGARRGRGDHGLPHPSHRGARACGVLPYSAICSFRSTRQVAALSHVTVRNATTQFVICSAATKC